MQFYNTIILCRFLTASPVHLVIAFCALNSFVIPHSVAVHSIIY